MQCKCKSLIPTPATLVDDALGLFKNSKLSKIFSSEGIAALDASFF